MVGQFAPVGVSGKQDFKPKRTMWKGLDAFDVHRTMVPGAALGVILNPQVTDASIESGRVQVQTA